MRLPEDNNLYFACIDLSRRPCLVVGAGTVAAEKIDGLLAAGASVRVVAPEATEAIAGLAEEGRIQFEQRRFEPSDVAGAFVVVAATGDLEVEREVARVAEQRGCLVNVADVPELCNFILPAIVRSGPVAVGISTAGASPALAQRIKQEVAELLARPYGALAQRLKELRPWALANIGTYAERRDFFWSIVGATPDPLEALERGDNAAVEEIIERARRPFEADGRPA